MCTTFRARTNYFPVILFPRSPLWLCGKLELGGGGQNNTFKDLILSNSSTYFPRKNSIKDIITILQFSIYYHIYTYFTNTGETEYVIAPGQNTKLTIFYVRFFHHLFHANPTLLSKRKPQVIHGAIRQDPLHPWLEISNTVTTNKPTLSTWQILSKPDKLTSNRTNLLIQLDKPVI